MLGTTVFVVYIAAAQIIIIIMDITIASYVKWTIFTITLKKLCQKLDKIKLELFELIEGIMEYVRVDW